MCDRILGEAQWIPSNKKRVVLNGETVKERRSIVSDVYNQMSHHVIEVVDINQHPSKRVIFTARPDILECINE